MSTTTILFVDNNQDFLETRAEYLEQAGYRVLKACTIDEALHLKDNPSIRLAILDIRIVDDDDEWDTSGLNLAEQLPKSMPKIILTGFPTVDAVREMLKVRPSGMSVAIDFISKQEGPEVLLVSVSKTVSMLEIAQPHITERQTSLSLANNKDIFVVHGHDEAARQSVARFIEKLGLNAIILSEQTSGGRSIMELLEHYSNVSFAIVLLTPDDVGYPKDKRPKKPPYRARQNVIFELGFFIGCLTRERVRSLYTEGVEILSDYHGVIYIPMDTSGGWKGRLAKELEEAGFSIDPKKFKDAI